MVTETIIQSVGSTKHGEAAHARTTGRYSSIADLLSRSWVKKLLFVSSDMVAIVAAHQLTEAATRHWMKMPATALNPSGYYLFYIPFFTALLYALDGYKSLDLRRTEKELELIFKAVSFSFIVLTCANFVFFKPLGFSRYLMVGWYILALTFVLVARTSLRLMFAMLWRRGLARQRALLLGTPYGLADLQRRLSIQLHHGYDMTGILVDSEDDSIFEGAETGLPVLGGLPDWEAIADAEGATLIIVNLEDSPVNHKMRVLEIIRRCQEKRIEVEIYSSIFGAQGLRYERDEFSGYFRFYSRPLWSRATQRGVKVALDFLIGLVGSSVTLLMVPIIGLILKWEDGGTIFHRREYVGMDGRVHHFLKFRTMHENAEEILQNDPVLRAEFECSFKLKNDPRVSRAGRLLRKYSLDEFPQFFGVLTGQLSFVGPRAITPQACARYGELLPKLLSVKPGLTGFWQVMGRQTTTYEEKIQMDMFYIDQWSIWLDLVIIAKSFWEVVRAKGAY